MTATTQTRSPSPARAPRDPLALEHQRAVVGALLASPAALDRAASWGRRLATQLELGNRLLVAGNGGSAAEAQHLSAELVGRFRGDRKPFSAIALHADTSSFTAIVNDYGAEEAFARQVQAHGSPGDILIMMSTSGRSPNLLAAAERARRTGLTTWAMTGPLPNALAARVDDVLAVQSETASAVQEVHLVALHLLCAAFDDALVPAEFGARR
jgi:phosphoheptose isomerase